MRVEVIPNGVDIEKFSTPDSMFPQKDKTIITVSRLVKKNGVEDLVSAMAVVLKRIPDAKLLIVGDGPLKESLKTKTRSLGLEHNVEFLGEIPNEQLPHYLRKAVVFVRPSLSEGLGTAFLEAMASGVAIIGTPVGGIPDFLKDRETGLFCKVSDPDDIAQKIITLLSDGSLRQHIIDQARELISQKYTWDIIAEQFRNFYGTIANS